MSKFSLIVAMTKQGVIGKDNKLPWHISAELKNFKKLTMGKPLLMGRATFDSLGRKLLPGRKHVVVSSKPENIAKATDLFVVSNIEAALKHQVLTEANEVMVIGGATIFEAMLPLVSTMYISIIKNDYEGDTFFPEFDRQQWSVKSSSEEEEFIFEVWKRRG